MNKEVIQISNGMKKARHKLLLLIPRLVGYQVAANTITNDDTLNNIESTLNHELTSLHVANNANHQSALASIVELRTAITAAQQQIALLTVAPSTAAAAPAYVPAAPIAATNYRRRINQRGGCNNFSRGRGGGRNAHKNTSPPPHCRHSSRPK